MLAMRCFGSDSARRTLALACEEVDVTEVEDPDVNGAEAIVALENNRYSSKNSNNNHNDYNYNYAFGDVDGIADSNDNEQNNDNYNYNYNKAAAKWQHQAALLQQQKLYGNPIHSIYDFSRSQPQSQQQQQKQQQQQQRREFDDDPENTGNDFRLQLSDLNAAFQGVGRFVVEHQNPEQDQEQDSDNSSSNSNSNSQPQPEEELLLERRSRISRREPEAGQQQLYDNEYAAAAVQAGAPDARVDIEGEEDYAVAAEGQDVDEDADELSEQLPYGIQNVRKRRVRSVMPPAQQLLAPGPNSDEVTYQSLCPTNRVTVKLDSGEYRPNHYVEVTCAHNYAPQPPRVHNYDYVYRGNDLLRALLAERGEKREICSAIGFACIQLNRTIHLIRLNDASGCWESETRTVPSGCECMWPKHSYGDIGFYHQTQKRGRGGVRGRVAPNLDYKPGVGYRQLTVRARSPKAGPRSRRDDFGYESYELN
ncbi:Hypothetical predicted protein [Drosophila guanche]|uniref:Uncharacterized protein n=2 Tax=Drosophila guanche TaxID=7266 RepID=A0A3B0IZG7_DROGU|nr:Hypothetical predicted protein [Drosophila guanche]